MKPLTKKQIFNLEVKYSELNKAIIEHLEFKQTDWYNYKENWDLLSVDLYDVPEMTEDFIRDFADFFDWFALSESTLYDKNENSRYYSKEFIEEFKDRFDWVALANRQLKPKDICTKYKDRINWPRFEASNLVRSYRFGKWIYANPHGWSPEAIDEFHEYGHLLELEFE